MKKSYRLDNKVETSRLLVCKFFGRLNFEALLPLLDEVQEIERAYPEGFGRFTDLSDVEEIGIESKHIRVVSEMRQSAYRGPAVSSAIYASDPFLFGMCRMYAGMMYPAPINVGVFYSIEESAEWLDTKVDTLIISAT